jgi:hypothetical protein
MHPLVALSLLESMREIDLPAEDDPVEYENEVGARRLGANKTIADQIERYRALVDKDGTVSDEEIMSIMRLCGRRPDSGLVFSKAGRRAATIAVEGMSRRARVGLKILPGGLRDGLGWSETRRLALNVFGIVLLREKGHATAHPSGGSFGAEATADGSACEFFGSGVAALLRAFTDFEGAVTHDKCVARNDPRCVWRTHLASQGQGE